MSEELIQRNLISAPEKLGEWDFYNIGATSLAALMAAHIIPEGNYGRLKRKKPDALIVKNRSVIAAIEYKKPSGLRSKAQVAKAIRQELGVAQALKAKAYIVTDGKKSFWINPKTGHPILQENGSKITLNFDKTDAQCITLIGKILDSSELKDDKITAPSIVDPLPLATKVWQDLWSVSGATPENCLYSFVEVFIFKYLSDLQVLTGQYSFDTLLRTYDTNTEAEVLELYARIIRPKIKELFPAGPIDHTTIINGTIFVSKDEKAVAGYSTVFHKILQRFKEFGTLGNIDRDFKSRLFETFLKESISKKNWGQYFTPLKVVRSIVDMVDIKPGMAVCDPACGVGKFLLEPIAKDVHRYFEIKNNRIIPKITLKGFDKGFDREEQKTIILAKANMLIYMAELIRDNHKLTKSFADIFNEVFLLQTNSILGTLARPETEKYDLILTNPPYVMSGSSNLKEEIAKDTTLKMHFAISAMGIEGLFMEWIVRALKPGGKAFVVVPDGIFNRANDRRLREFILENCFIDAIISLPINTFFTTNKKTYILALEKKAPSSVGGIKTLPRQETPVFTYLCSEIGETRDTYRFDIEQNDLKTATEQFNMFKGAKSVFQSKSGRCKLLSILQFYSNQNWCIDSWWTKEEKIALGIVGNPSVVSITDFSMMVKDFSAVMSELCEPIDELALAPKNNYKIFKLAELFTPIKGQSKYTKKFGNLHRGQYPVYSASSHTPLTYIDTYDYDGKYLSWSTNGFAGTMLVIDGKFSLNGDRGVLVPRNGRNDLDLEYMKYTLEPIFRGMAKGRKGDRGEDEFTKLYPSMIADIEVPVPMDGDGNIDLDAQKEIAARYKTVAQCKRSIVEKCNALIAQKVKV